MQGRGDIDTLTCDEGLRRALWLTYRFRRERPGTLSKLRVPSSTLTAPEIPIFGSRFAVDLTYAEEGPALARAVYVGVPVTPDATPAPPPPTATRHMQVHRLYPIAHTQRHRLPALLSVGTSYTTPPRQIAPFLNSDGVHGRHPQVGT